MQKIQNKQLVDQSECGQQLDQDTVSIASADEMKNLQMSLLSGVPYFGISSLAMETPSKCFIIKNKPSQGYFIVNKRTKQIMLQATHAHDDLLTGILVKNLLQSQAPISYAYISSVERSILDSTKTPSVINELSVNFMQARQIQNVIQLHGFSRTKRKTNKGKNTDILISSGDESGSLIANSVYQCLKKSFDNVNLYGKDIYELGATNNYLKNTLNDAAYPDKFIHIELSLAMRKELLKTTSLNRFANCLKTVN